MGKDKVFEFESIFSIEGGTVEDILHWATVVAGIDVEHLRTCLVAGGELCDLCLSLSAYYDINLTECRRLIKERKGGDEDYELVAMINVSYPAEESKPSAMHGERNAVGELKKTELPCLNSRWRWGGEV